MVSDTWIIVGLGNPGPTYANNRHNIGHHVIAELLGRAGAKLSRHRSGALAAEIRIGMLPGGAPGPRAVVAVPNSFMNVSGRTTAKLAVFYGTQPDHFLVVHDELDLPAHQLRLKIGGGEGGHNGLRSISQSLGTRDYARLRVGIGRPPGRQDPADYVLSDFPTREHPDWQVTVTQAADAIEDVVVNGFTDAQMRLHTLSK